MENNTTIKQLRLARQELLLHEQELEKCSSDLKNAKEKLQSATEKELLILQEAHDSLEDMMFAISHNIRKAVSNILGISKLLYENKNLKEDELREFLTIIMHSAESLNTSTEDLSNYIHLKKKNIKELKS